MSWIAQILFNMKHDIGGAKITKPLIASDGEELLRNAHKRHTRFEELFELYYYIKTL